jgi:hypothetical protein
MSSFPASTVPPERLVRIEEILDRSRRMTGPELGLLVKAARAESVPGDEDAGARARSSKRTRVISIAVARSGLAATARDVEGAASAAVRTAAGTGTRFDRFGLLCDAELAAADAALSVLLEDHLSAEMAAFLRRPFERATGDPGEG